MSLRALLQPGASILAGLALLPSASSATLLYVSSYSGTVSTLNLTSTTSGAPSLELVATSHDCGSNASWLTLDKPASTLYCLDENLSNVGNGTLTKLSTSPEGDLKLVSNSSTPLGPVSGVIYGKNGAGIALAEYVGHAISAYDTRGPNLTEVYYESFTHVTGPNQNPGRQDNSHPHEAVLDPTGAYLLVPDLGNDLVRVWNVDQQSLALNPSTPLEAPAGSGPRHVDFLKTEKTTFMYLISELANTITAYKVTYNCNGTLGFNEVFVTNTHGDGTTPPSNATAAEIHLSPDNKFILVTSRGEVPTTTPGDPLITFSVNSETGALTHVQTIGTGGRIPRQFSINKAGTLVSVGSQTDGVVTILERDVDSGMLTGPVASLPIEGKQVTCVIFDE